MKPKGWRNESRRHSLASKGIKTAQKINLGKLRKADDIFRGRYYTSGKGKQIVRKWNVKDGGASGFVELTTAIMDDGKKWYEVRVRNTGWRGGFWIGKDYDSKKLAEESVKIAMQQLKKMQTQNLPFAEVLKEQDADYPIQKAEVKALQDAMPKEDW